MEADTARFRELLKADEENVHFKDRVRSTTLKETQSIMITICVHIFKTQKAIEIHSSKSVQACSKVKV